MIRDALEGWWPASGGRSGDIEHGRGGGGIDAAGLPVAPVIAWFDDRTIPQRTGGGSTWAHALCRHLWATPGLHFFDQQSDVDAGACARSVPAYHTLVRVSDYLNYRLTGQQVTSPSIASRTMAFDVRSGIGRIACWIWQNCRASSSAGVGEWFGDRRGDRKCRTRHRVAGGLSSSAGVGTITCAEPWRAGHRAGPVLNSVGTRRY